MNGKRFVLTFIVIFVLLEIFGYLIHTVILSSTYMGEGIKQLFRPADQMNSYMWIIWVTDLIWSYMFVFFFVKGFENKGIFEGLRYGFYMGVFYSFVQSYQAFVVYPLPYSLTLQWFIYGFVEMLIFGFVVALLYKPKTAAVPEPSVA